MVVQHNISAMNANRYYGINNKALAGSLEKLSSGYAINRAGDNAAGLAVSEKMRAQIGGLTQASKNAEDGISMVQTFEGALQETDSILQRMRSLAVQSANGNYQDDVDREAIQLEFDQLNDELNQIADTDFNGVVVLNGGQMADGLKAVDNKFDYANKKDQILDAVKNELVPTYEADLTAEQTRLTQVTQEADQEYNDAIADTLSAYNTAQANETAGKYDVSQSAGIWNAVDGTSYDKDNADNLWKDLGLTDTGDATGNVDLSKGKSVDITFTYDKTANTWTATSGTITDATGAKTSLDADALTAAGISTQTETTTDGTGNGGFTVKSTSASNFGDLGNSVFNTLDVTDGSTVTLTYTNDVKSQTAPTDIGWDASATVTSTGTTDIAAPTIKMGDIGDDDIKTQEIADTVSALDGKEFSATYTGGSATLNSATLGGVDISGALTTADGAQVTVDGKDYWVAADNTTAPTKITISLVDSSGSTPAAGKSIAEIGITAPSATTGETVGSVSGKIAIGPATYADSTANIKITAGDDPNLESQANMHTATQAAEAAYNTAEAGAAAARDAKIAAQQAKVDAAQAKLDHLNSLKPEESKADWEEVKGLYSQHLTGSKNGVSVSDNFDNSKAKLTYADNMILQVGARTKDSVNFTFEYSSNDLGGLEANLNCSAREGGLNTANLSVSTQSGANDAIDQIDKALNKVNMVRATFGAVQNRLEHKINNIDTNTENLTAAESRIRDTQMDKEMMKFTSAQILSQASQSMLAQANSLPQGVLQLLG